MSAVRGLTLPPALVSARQQARARWRAFAPRERRLLTAVFWLVGLFLVWSIGLQPALRTLNSAPEQLNVLDLQLQQMQQMAVESATLRRAPTVSASQASAALKSATDHLGTQGRLTVQGDRATLTVTAVTGARLNAWLTEARSAARIRPVEAQLTRSAQGYTGTIVVQLGGQP
ncbi:MAG: ral secretion pathway protein GspM [Rhizobacter sp.]|nr:ral secretion pathway protein GspM [Rhizobacter sp.]